MTFARESDPKSRPGAGWGGRWRAEVDALNPLRAGVAPHAHRQYTVDLALRPGLSGQGPLR